MSCTQYQILDRSRNEPPEPARFSHFTLGPSSEIADAASLIADPRWSLYGIDGTLRQAMFVQLPEEIDLSDVPFVYAAQYDHATAALIVPFDELAALAAHVPAPEKIIFLFSIGRCGSTLTSRILAADTDVLSLSEPDIYTNLTMDRSDIAPEDIDLVLTAGTRLLFNPRAGSGKKVLAIKLRSQSLVIAERFATCLPDAVYLFLYREPSGWVRSLYHFVVSMGFPIEMEPEGQIESWTIISGNSDPAYLAPFMDFPEPSSVFYRLLAPAWMLFLETFIDLQKAGNDFHPLRYENFKAEPEEEARRLLHLCGLTHTDSQKLLAALSTHSQKGTFLDVAAGADQFSADREAFMAMLAKSPRFDEVSRFSASQGFSLDA